MTRTFSGSRIDLTKNCPFQTFELLGEKGEEGLAFTKIAVNEDVEDAEFVFPSIDDMKKSLHVEQLKVDGPLSIAGSLTTVMRACYTRAAAHHPELRTGFITSSLMGIRWSKVVENDNHYAPLVKKLVPPEFSLVGETIREKSASVQFSTTKSN